MTTALVVIDVQRALCEGDYAAFEADRVIDTINGLARQARTAGLPVVFVQHEETDGPFAFESAGWQLPEALEARPDDLRVRKTTPDSFHRTPLQELLHERGVSRLVVCGMQSDFCVDTTVRRALALGYEVTLPADAHTTLDNGVLSAAQIIAHHNETLSQMKSFGPRVTVKPATEIAVSG